MISKAQWLWGTVIGEPSRRRGGTSFRLPVPWAANPATHRRTGSLRFSQPRPPRNGEGMPVIKVTVLVAVSSERLTHGFSQQ